MARVLHLFAYISFNLGVSMYKALSLILLISTTLASSIQVNYLRKDSKYDDYGIHLYGKNIPTDHVTSWPEVHKLEIKDDQSSLTIPLQNDHDKFNLLVHSRGHVDINPLEISPLDFKKEGVWLVQGANIAFKSKEEAVKGMQKVYDIRARWISKDTIAFRKDDINGKSFSLHFADDGDIRIKDNKVIVKGSEDAGHNLAVTGDFNSESADFYKKFAYLRDHNFSRINLSLDEELVRKSIKSHAVLVARDENGNVTGSTALHRAGLIDELFTYDGEDLGIKFVDAKPVLKLWTPTAHEVKVRVYSDSSKESEIKGSPFPLVEKSGVWEIEGKKNWKNKFFLYEIKQFHREKGIISVETTTDYNSVSLSTNSNMSQIVDIENDFIPQNWNEHQTKEFFPSKDPTDMSIYELHTRDFSIFDKTVDSKYRGTFKAFTQKSSNGMKHLRSLAESGLTHIHFLPINDIASINEDKASRIDIFDPIEKLIPNHPMKGETIEQVLSSFPADSEKQQEIVALLKDLDGYNWGYDPHHFMVPEGSYSSEPNGAARILELRQAVQSLHEVGLKVIIDVVYNHTYDNTVLNKIVPDYFYRLDHLGNPTKDSCCFDTASEYTMVKKMIVDSTVNWAKFYKVDGVRFDLMNFITKETMTEIRGKLNALTKARNGIDGKSIYMYGEGWDFGSLKWLLPNESTTQGGAIDLKMELGSFNDKFRDSIKGKGQNERELFEDDSYLTDKVGEKDQVMSSLRGTQNDWGNGMYNSPNEAINYLDAHDKATLWDHLLAKVGDYASIEKMIKMQQLGIGFISLSQGIPFFHAGVEILRSKSGDENSYNSGDWYNKLDFTYTTNNWAKGLPPAWQEENLHAWPNWKGKLQRIPAPTPAQIKGNLEYFKDLLKIRKSSKLFRLNEQGLIRDKLSFPPTDNKNLLVMKLDDSKGTPVDDEIEKIYVLFNNTWNDWIDFYDEDLKSGEFELHPVHVNTVEPDMRKMIDNSGSEKKALSFTDQGQGKISVPCMTSLVYILKRAKI